ncbi:hypothetical protein MNB_SV-15-660 [hydrothermal vent metagenome]|uniref:YhcG N-terminal domain-containing protein n=1 Tax=hydrothermal vent metagenome TaxID=652676 RepID=A0A1W1EHK6_9ZZZZ
MPNIQTVEYQKRKQLVSQLVQIPWGDNIVIIQKNKDLKKVILLAQNTIRRVGETHADKGGLWN